MDIIDRSANILTTKEFWNVSLDNDVDHVSLKVRYELIPFTLIRYEILSGPFAGVKNSIYFSVSKDNPDSESVIEFALPILDIAGHPWAGKRSSVYVNIGTYLRTQDAQYMEKIQMHPFMIGQSCLKCKKGKLNYLPGIIAGIENHTTTVERFECDCCHQIITHTMSVSSDRVGIDDTGRN